MKLNDDPFKRIKEGTKTVELRLNDEKRQLVKKGDLIEFTNRETLEKITTEVVDLYKYPSFAELYKHIDPLVMGYDAGDVVDPKDMEQYYNKEEEEKYGVVGIKLILKKVNGV